MNIKSILNCLTDQTSSASQPDVARLDLTENELVSKTYIANFIFDQIKLQQEVRDRWFGYCLSTNAATAAMSATLANTSIVSPSFRIVAAAIPLGINSILGQLYYELYLRQRRNYMKHYNILNFIQEDIISSTMSREQYSQFYTNVEPFASQLHGADYFSLQIQATLTSSYAAISTGLLLLETLSHHVGISVIAALFIGVFIFVMLQLRRRKVYWQ